MNKSYEQLLKKIEDKTAVVGVIGMGYVGLPFLVEKAKVGLNVIGFDKSKAKIDSLLNKESYIDDISNEELASIFQLADVKLTTDPALMSEADVLVICVPTPLDKNRCPDLGMVESVCRELKDYLRPGQLVSLESTTYPGTTEELMKPILEQSGLKCGEDFFLAYSPERVDPGNARYTTKNTNKVVGADDELSRNLASKFYQLAIDHVVPVSSAKTAELVKVYENTFRAVNIALVNQMALLCHKMDIDVWEMLEAAFTKPFGIMPFYPGPGVGGHCIPIDPHYLEWKAKEFGFETSLINLAGEINRKMPLFVVDRIRSILNKKQIAMNGSKIYILGVAYKANLADYRESPAMDIIRLLRKEGVEITYSDPYVDQFELDGESFVQVLPTAKIIKQQDCVVVLAKHKGIDYLEILRHAASVLDTRNVDLELGQVEKL